MVPANDRERDELSCRLEQAVQQALELRQTLSGLFGPDLRGVLDVVLIELGRRIAALR
ncbi:hypothetical protein [Methylobacterium longum]|uniref:hypothetical protein n=1 Tax=Methylobacterium longum TaxID=767694 RepID=UPI001EE18C41|nr:hypothetical protein [Methylobacterium longum]